MKNKENKSLLSKSCEYIYEIISNLLEIYSVSLFLDKTKPAINAPVISATPKNSSAQNEKSDDDDSIDISVNDDSITIS